MRDPGDAGAQIRMKRPSLTRLEGKLAADSLALKDFDETTPLREIALKSEAVDAMVVKIPTKPDLDGHRDVQQGLVDPCCFDTANLQAEVDVAKTAGEIVRKVFGTARQALEETFVIPDPESFDGAADDLGRAKQRDFYRPGGSAQIARDVSHKLRRIRTPLFDDAHMMKSAAVLGLDDVAMAFSHSGAIATEMTRRNGVQTTAVTNHPESGLTPTVDVFLRSTAQNTLWSGKNDRIAQLNLMDALFVAVAQHDHKAADANLNRSLPAVPSKRRL